MTRPCGSSSLASSVLGSISDCPLGLNTPNPIPQASEARGGTWAGAYRNNFTGDCFAPLAQNPGPEF